MADLLHRNLNFNHKYYIIRYAGVGAEFKCTSVIEVDGVPPLLKNVSILHSAYNGINITTSDSVLDLQDCIIKNNRGITYTFKFL